MEYDIVIVLCPEKKDPDDKFPEFKNNKYLGGQTRMDAACEIFKKNKGAEFVLVGGYDQNSKKSKKVEDMREFLKEKCENIIILERPSLPCTRHNLVAVFNYWIKERKEIKGKKIGILTNFYHLPRALRFWGELVNEKEFSEIPVPIPIIAESIVEKSDAYTRFIEYILRTDSEINGLKDNEKGTYKDNCLDKNMEHFKSVINDEKEILLTSAERSLNDNKNFRNESEASYEFSRISEILKSKIFDKENLKNPLVQSAFAELVIRLRNLLYKCDNAGNRINFTDDIVILKDKNGKVVVGDVTDAVRYIRNSVCHIESDEYLLDNKTVFYFNIAYGKIGVANVSGIELVSDYEDDVCFFFGDQKLYLNRHIIRAFNEAKRYIDNSK
ncbi:MAG: ElyC/SanA/YdcF family protein [Candidatus Pacebacteria bacterium]|nr:ElyC/SanA/YdcF family protein [Candidatus Paceibacterota bacterium]